MRILRAEIWACNDCTVYLCNGDLSGVDGADRVREIEEGCAQPHIVPNFDSESGVGIHTDDYDDFCQFCGAPADGSFHRFAQLGEGPEELDHDGARECPIVNPCDHDYSRRTSLYRMWVSDGAYSGKNVYVWATSFDDAFEELVEWTDAFAPGYLSKSAELLADMDPEERAAAEESGEIPDYTIIGHTTLDHGDCIASWCWGGDEVTCEPLIEAVRLLSA